MECPKCGRTIDDGAFICPGCEFILDTSFLGDDITDDERAIRKRKDERKKKAVDFGEDAMILGNASEQEFSDFRSRDAGVSQREVTQARFYIGGVTAQLLHPDAVPEVVADAFSGSIRMTPFERHVLEFINGKRSIARIQKKSGMEDSEFKTSVAMLGDKGVIRLRTMKKKKKGMPSLLQGSVSEQRAVAHGFEAGDRTIVAPPPDAAPPRSQAKGAPASEAPKRVRSGGFAFHDDASETELAMPRADRAPSKAEGKAIGKAEGTAARGTGDDRFRSLRAESEVDGSASTSRPGDAWGSGAAPANSSNVFARAKAAKKKQSEPSLVDEDADLPLASAESASASGMSESLRARLQPPDGEAQVVPEQESLPPGVPPEDDDDLLFAPGSGETASLPARGARDAAPDAVADDGDEFDAPTGPRRPLATSNTMTRERAVPDERVRALPDRGVVHDEHTEARDLTSVPTGPLPDSAEHARPPPLPPDDEDEVDASAALDTRGAARDDDAQDADEELPDDEDDAPDHARAADDDDADDDDDELPDDEEVGFDVDLHTATADRMSKQRTASLPPSVPELPSDALLPLPQQPASAQNRPAMSIPGQPLYNAGTPASPAPPSLPGQALLRPATGPAASPAPRPSPATAPPGGGRPAATVKPGAGPPRPSAGSTVPFEQARKAEKIFEQAQKDHAEGRMSSARMNAKLATQFDPSIPAYKDFLAMLDEAAAGQKPGLVKPRELILFEQASEAEGRGDYKKAVDLLKQAIEVNSKAGALFNRLGVVLSIRLKQHDEALGYLKRAIELEPGSLVYMNNFSKVTAALESQRERDPEEKKKNSRMDKDNKVEIKKMRPKMF